MARTSLGHGSAPRITPRVRQLLDALVQGRARSVAEATKLASLSERAGHAALKKPHVQAEMERMIRQRLSVLSFPRAAVVLDELLSAGSEYVRSEVARHVLAVHGVKPTADAAPGTAGGIVFKIVRRNADGTTSELVLAAGGPPAEPASGGGG